MMNLIMPLLAATSPAADAEQLRPNEIFYLFLSLAVLLGLARLLGELMRKLHQPSVLGEILAGILLGPTILGQLNPELFSNMFPVNGHVFIGLESLITVSAAFLLLAAGLEVELSIVWKQGKSALLVAAVGMIVPFGMGFAMASLVPDVLGMGARAEALPFAVFVGIALSITALPVIAKILIDLNMFKSDMGMLIMSGAMLNDLVGWMGFAIVLALMGTQAGESAHAAGGLLPTLLFTFAFLFFMLVIWRAVSHRLIARIQAHLSYPGGVLSYVMVCALACAAITEWIGIHSIFGAFIAGVAVGDSSHLRERTRDTIHQFITNIFAPIFFASIGLHVNFVESFDLGMVLIVLVIACLGKIGGCYLGGRLAGMDNRLSLAVGFGMVAQGTMGVILGKLARLADLIDDQMFVAIVIMALTTSLMSGPGMQKILRRKQQRQLGDVLTEKQFVPELRAKDVRAALGELAARAAQICGLESALIFNAVWEREQAIHTGLGHGLAVPHARLADLKKPLVIVGRSHGGLDFDAPDGQPARIVCMLLTPRTDQSAQIELLDMVARGFIQESTRVAAMSATNFTEFLAALNLGNVES